MNPLKYQLPDQQTNDITALHPQPNALKAWMAAQPAINVHATGPLLLKVLQAYNDCAMPAAMRLKAMITLQPMIDKLVKQLHGSYQGESLPLPKGPRAQADMAAEFLEQTAIAYKRVVADAAADSEKHEMSINLFIAALRLAIDHLGKQLLESYVQYAPPQDGLWGEIHRTYQFAERNGLHTRALSEEGKPKNPLATVQHGYLQLVLLALTLPNHLMPGQANLIYEYLNKWTAGCRILSSKLTEVETGDIFVDLASEQAPQVATGYARFRPLDGRFLDISQLKQKLDEICDELDAQQEPKTGTALNIAERLRRDLLTRLRKVWRGRAERATPRETNLKQHIRVCLGLDACHHFLSDEAEFMPEQSEFYYHRPHNSGGELELVPTQNPWETISNKSTDHLGQDTTRLSRFGSKADVWDTVLEHDIHARDKRDAARSHFLEEPWLCVNESHGGLALRRLPDTQSRTRVGSVVAFREDEDKNWKVGSLVWLSDTPKGHFEIGVMTLARTCNPVSVRAIGGAGNGGEYFRSLIIQPTVLDGGQLALLVPASIYDIGTQLVINREKTLEYVRLTRLVDTTSAYSLFEYKHIGVPPAEKARIDNLPHYQ